MTEKVATFDGAIGTQDGFDGKLAWRIETAREDADGTADAGRRSGNALFHMMVTVRPRDGASAGEVITLETLTLAVASP